MNEAATTNEPVQPNEADTSKQTPDISDSMVRNHALFRKLISSKDAEIEGLSKKIAEIQTAQEQAQLEGEKNYTAAKAKIAEQLAARTAELESLKVSHSTQLREVELRYKLAMAGANDELVVDGAIASYHRLPTEERPEIDAWIATLKETKPGLFGSTAAGSTKVAAPSPAGSPASRPNSTDWAQLKKDLRSPAKATDARKAIEAAMARGEKRPENWKQL